MKKIFLILLLFTISLNAKMVKEYYDNGALKNLKQYQNGKLEGISEVYSEDGKIKSRSSFKNGVLDGQRVFYYDNGRVKKRENFKNGKRDGTCKRYYVNGNIQIINSYRDGKKDGLFKKIYENGKLYQEVIFKNDKVVNAFAYDENGLRGSLIGKYEDEIIVD